MDLDSPKVQAYLYQLNQMAGGDPAVQVSMYEVGEALGIEKDDASQMAEILFMGGHAELKTLSGGIGITPMGMESLGVTPARDAAGDPCLSGETVVTDQDRANIDDLLDEVRSAVAAGRGEYQFLETVVVDIKTIEVQMLSPSAKTAVVREVLRSMAHTLTGKAFFPIRTRITAMAGD